jgi:hypothetical protein
VRSNRLCRTHDGYCKSPSKPVLDCVDVLRGSSGIEVEIDNVWVFTFITRRHRAQHCVRAAVFVTQDITFPSPHQELRAEAMDGEVMQQTIVCRCSAANSLVRVKNVGHMGLMG